MHTLKSARRLAGILRTAPTGEALETAVTELASLRARLPPDESWPQQEEDVAPATHHERLIQEAGHLAKRAADVIRQLDKKHSADGMHQASLQQRRLLQQSPDWGTKRCSETGTTPLPNLGL